MKARIEAFIRTLDQGHTPRFLPPLNSGSEGVTFGYAAPPYQRSQ